MSAQSVEEGVLGSRYEPSDRADTPEALSVLAAVLRHPRLVGAIGAIGLVLGLLYVAMQWSNHTATARLVLRDPWQADVSTTDKPVGGDYERFVRSQTRFIKTDEVLTAAAEDAGVSVSALSAGVSAGVGGSADVLVLTSVAGSSERAESNLDAVVQAYGEQRLALVRAQADAVYEGIEEEEEANGNNLELRGIGTNLRVAVAAYGNGVSFVERTEAVADLSPFKRLAIPLAAAIAFLGLGSLAAWIFDDRRPRVHSPAVFAAQRGVSFLGNVATPCGESLTVPTERSEAEAALLALANVLRSKAARSSSGSYAVVLVAADEQTDVSGVARVLEDFATDHGGTARVVPADVRQGPTNAVDIEAEHLAGARVDLLLFTTAPPTLDFTALRLAQDADAVVVVTRVGSDANAVHHGMDLFDNSGRAPRGIIGTSPSQEL